MQAPLRRLLLSAGVALTTQCAAQPLGRLLYTNRAGRAITLKVGEGGHPTLMVLQPEQGDAERFRRFILAHTGPEGLAAQGAVPLPEKAPLGWKVRANRGDGLMKAAGCTFWRYTASWVLPVRFTFDGQAWELLSADLPPPDARHPAINLD